MIAEIRNAQPGDFADWLPLWEGYLEFYKVTIEPHITATTWARILDPMNLLTSRVALVGGNMVGFANHHTHLTTWDTRPVCYLEDLFVSPSGRGMGIGRQLIDDMIAMGKQKDWASVYWITAEDNTTAQGLYDTYNKRDAFIRYSVVL
ncbi:GNAT family N-acetyltransferase [Rhizobium sp. KVB221]|uniref:GNAT family N-acetyltransferase n=1 Tax=Rhizobium setariae TaxID=2801340 RepID=A0A936YU57_9HYPH|nr:GNAT family N-acetyltransferase [Rhizobium setariae]MBL0372600.1 GNAT family N-acetyltransferase [Rhizobium setariae]